MFGTPNKLRKEFLVSTNFYPENLPSVNSLYSELDVFFTHCENLNTTTDLPNSVAATLDSVAFPNISIFLGLFAAFAVCTFSSLKHTKTLS